MFKNESLIDYCQFITRTNAHDNDAFIRLKNALKQNLIDKKIISVYLEQLIEYNSPIVVIKELFNYDYDNNIKNKELFKWACGYSSLNTIKFLDQHIINKDITGSIQCAIKNYRVEVVEYLIEKKYPVLTLLNFYRAVSDSGFVYAGHDILDIFINNIANIPLDNYFVDIIQTSHLSKDDKHSHILKKILTSINKINLEKTLLNEGLLNEKINEKTIKPFKL